MNDKKIISNEIKAQNRQMIYQFIRNSDPVSKQDLVVGLQLSLPTVTQNLQYLEEQGLIDTSQKIKYTGGRNATAYSYIKNAKQAIGVYISTNHINAVAVNLSGHVIEMSKRRIKFNLEDDAYLRYMGEAVEAVKKGAGIRDEDLLGVGIAVPGLVSKDGETVTYGGTHNFKGKTRTEIAKYIPYKTKMFHDSIVAGYAEVWIDQEIQNAFYISLNNSVGGAFVFGNEIYTGDTYKGGEIGHMTVVHKKGRQCYCGKYGCFDTVCHAGNLDQYTDGNLERFFSLLEEGESQAVRMWNEYLDFLAQAIHNIRMLFDCKIILGGHVGAQMEKYMGDLSLRVDERNSFDDKSQNYLIPCKYKIEATAAGAAIMFIDDFIDNI